MRTYFVTIRPFATAPPLRLGPAQPPEGFQERRVYRVLFAKDLARIRWRALRAVWRTADDGTAGGIRRRVATTRGAATSSRGTCDGSATPSPGLST